MDGHTDTQKESPTIIMDVEPFAFHDLQSAYCLTCMDRSKVIEKELLLCSYASFESFLAKIHVKSSQSTIWL